MPIKVVIVEDEPHFQEWIQEELSDAADIEVCGLFSDGDTAIRKIKGLEPDIVLMDLDLGHKKMDGCRCIFKVRQQLREEAKRYPEDSDEYNAVMDRIKFMVLSSHIDDTHVFKALKMGAKSYLYKSDIPDELTNCIRSFHNGIPRISSAIALKLVEFHTVGVADLEKIDKLTKRQKEVLDMLIQGHTYYSAGCELFIAEGTVRQHVNKAYKKLEVNCLAEAIELYGSGGL